MASQLYLISFIAIIVTISGVESQKNKGSSCIKDGKTYQVRIILELRERINIYQHSFNSDWGIIQ